MVGKIKEYVPVAGGHRVFAFADVVSKPAGHKLTQRRHLESGHCFHSEQSIDGTGGLQDFKLSRWVGPFIPFCIRKKHGSWRTDGDQAVLVEGQTLRRVV